LNCLLTVLFLIDGKIEQKQIQVLEGDILDEGHDETRQEETPQRELYLVPGP